MSFYSWKYVGFPLDDMDKPCLLKQGIVEWSTEERCLVDAKSYYYDIAYPYNKVLCVTEKPGIKYPRFKTLLTREKTFKEWPPTIPVQSQQLAAAGFFYTGYADKVTCFCCGITLKKWESDDVAMVEHKKHAPECNYLALHGTT